MLGVHNEVGRRGMEGLRFLPEFCQSLCSEGLGQSNFSNPPGMYEVHLFVCLFSSLINRVFAFSLPLFICNKTLCTVVDKSISHYRFQFQISASDSAILINVLVIFSKRIE